MAFERGATVKHFTGSISRRTWFRTRNRCVAGPGTPQGGGNIAPGTTRNTLDLTIREANGLFAAAV